MSQISITSIQRCAFIHAFCDQTSLFELDELNQCVCVNTPLVQSITATPQGVINRLQFLKDLSHSAWCQLPGAEPQPDAWRPVTLTSISPMLHQKVSMLAIYVLYLYAKAKILYILYAACKFVKAC